MAKFKNESSLRKSKTTIDLSSDLKGYKGNQRDKKALLNSIGKMLKREITEFTKAQISPVDGSKFKKLSKTYGNLKKKLAGNKKANLHLKNEMIKSITFKTNSAKNTIEIGIMGRDKALDKKKSYNHNQAKSKKAPLPKRRFLPTAKKDKFNGAIMKSMKQMIKDAKEESQDASED